MFNTKEVALAARLALKLKVLFSLERKTGQLFAKIIVGDLPFTVKLTPKQNKEHVIFPGQTISIRYRLGQIKWI